MEELRDSRPASLEEVLREREERGRIQRELLARYRMPLLCVTMNLPGAFKLFPLARNCFRDCMRDLYLWLGHPPAFVKTTQSAAGLAAYYAVDRAPEELKRSMILLEETHPVGRLLDLDVVAAGGKKLSREALGLPGRTCLLCHRPAFACSRGGAHAESELLQAVLGRMKSYQRNVCRERAVSAAARALLEEAVTTPKPGLVDRANTGAHSDMDLFSFIGSAAALLPFFGECAEAGYTHTGTPAGLFEALRGPGVLAERKMLAATGQVNTHKGAIFSIGIASAAYGALYRENNRIEPDALLSLCGEIARPSMRDLDRPSPESSQTNGERVFAQSGVAGIRGEAAAGYPNVREHGLPALQKMLRGGHSRNDAGVAALLALMAHVDDTNIIKRSDLATLRAIQNRLRKFLSREPSTEIILQEAARLDKEFTRRRISAGGCADLLAVTCFVHSVCAQDADALL